MDFKLCALAPKDSNVEYVSVLMKLQYLCYNIYLCIGSRCLVTLIMQLNCEIEHEVKISTSAAYISFNRLNSSNESLESQKQLDAFLSVVLFK